MNAIAQWLKEKGKIVIPKTLDTQVFDENGKSLDRRLKTAKDEQVIQLPKVEPTMIISDLDYSTEEQLTGKRWTDGKPIYQKTIEFSFESSSTVYVDISDDIDIVLYAYGFAKNSKYMYNISMYTQGIGGQFLYDYAYPNQLRIRNTNSDFDKSSGYVTVMYTKTTDTASSPVAPLKVETMHGYSTEEKVVGTWIDGKTLYEKTVLYDGVIKQNTKIYQDDSIGEFIDVFNKYFYDTNFGYWCGSINGDYELNISSAGKSLNGNVDSAYGSRITKCRCTIQYTKTTDTATV